MSFTPKHVVGIGASAGGIEAFLDMVRTFRADDTAFIFLVHYPQDRDSRLPEVLQKRSSLPVERIETGTRVRRNVIYVMVPGREVILRERVLYTRPIEEPRWESIDRFFCTLAEELGSASIGVILSGTGRDGARGLRRIKAAGGLTCVQSPPSALHPDMPRAALPSADLCFEPVALGLELMRRLGIEPLRGERLAVS